MNLGAVVSLDTRIPEQARQMKHALRSLRAFKGRDAITIKDIDSVILAYVQKYSVAIDFGLRKTSKGFLWTASASEDDHGTAHGSLGIVYGHDRAECFSKLLCVLDARSKENALHVRRK